MTEIPTDAIPASIQQAAGLVDSDVPQYVDYFAPADKQKVLLPDGVQSVTVQVLSEGQRRQYLNSTNQEFTMNARTRDLKMRSNLGDEAHALLEVAVVDWDVRRGGNPIAFSTRALKDALDAWPPALIDHIVKAVRDLNPWLKGEEDVDAMEQEYEDLGRRIEEAKARAAKNS